MVWYEIVLSFLALSGLFGLLFYTCYLCDKEQKRIKVKDEKILKYLEEISNNTRKDD